MAVHARQLKVGVNLATSGSWGTTTAGPTATAVGVGDGHYVRDDLDIQLQMMQVLDDASGQNYIGSVQTSHSAAINGKIPLYLHYHDSWMNVLWALTLGAAGTSPTQLSTSTAYTNTFEPATNKTGRYATIVRDKSVDIFEVPGAKFSGFEVRATDMGRMEVDFSFSGDTEKENSTINTATQITALTFPTLGLRAFIDDCVFRINAQGGGALGASDTHTIRALRLKFAQPLDIVYVGGKTTIIEPEENGFPDVELEVTFGRYDAASDAFFAGHRSTTAYKADLTFTGPAIGALATSYGLLFQFPNLYVKSYANPVPAGAGQVIPGAVFGALSTTAAPTGMTGVTVPLRLVTTGVSTTNPLA